jgi:hypothetical protein
MRLAGAKPSLQPRKKYEEVMSPRGHEHVRIQTQVPFQSHPLSTPPQARSQGREGWGTFQGRGQVLSGEIQCQGAQVWENVSAGMAGAGDVTAAALGWALFCPPGAQSRGYMTPSTLETPPRSCCLQNSSAHEALVGDRSLSFQAELGLEHSCGLAALSSLLPRRLSVCLEPGGPLGRDTEIFIYVSPSAASWRPPGVLTEKFSYITLS